MNTVLFPGTFDPITGGHIDIIDRSSRLFDRVIVTMAVNSAKQTLFTDDERESLIRESLKEELPDRTNIDVVRITGLLVDYARNSGAIAAIRGLRTPGDFEYEMQMAMMNRRLYNEMTTIFIPADEKYASLSSTLIREVARYGADVSGMVPACVARELRRKWDESR